ncbi:MAG: hypothetical protein KDA79_07105 [Planctomycetaceae bacterium]|nr:hypothetical protein [Planctomycetaceae bacterium]
MQQRTGLTVLGDYVLSEGVDAVLENLKRAGVTDVATNPTVTEPSPVAGEGSFQPPTDAGSSPRVFDRPLFGHPSLWVRSAVSYQPNPEHYRHSAYAPRVPNDLTDRSGPVIAEFIEKATAAGIRVQFQLGAAQPSGLRDEDRPRLPHGELPARRVADTASLASDTLRDWIRAIVADLLEAYPRLDGFRIDWPESPCYTLEEAFQDFSPFVSARARELGFNYDQIHGDVARLWDLLHGGLRDAHLADLASPSRGQMTVLGQLLRAPGVGEWLRLKQTLSAELMRFWRKTLTEAGGEQIRLSINAFMPPWTLATGFGFATAAEVGNSVSPKLYTMHWSQMVEFWGREILEANPGLDERLLTAALVHLMDLTDEPCSGKSLADYGYPAPDEPHPVSEAVQLRKIRQATAACGNPDRLCPLVHGYGPLEDFTRRLNLVARSGVRSVWINRYGYLSDAKLEAIARVWR